MTLRIARKLYLYNVYPDFSNVND